MKDTCPICNTQCKRINVNHPYFNHVNYQTIKKNGIILKCNLCHTVTNLTFSLKVSNNFKTKKYANSLQTKQTIITNDNISLNTRSYFQAKILLDNCNIQSQSRILDIGCFDGQFLRQMENILPKSEFWGYDINDHLKSHFRNKKNYKFVCGDLNSINKTFDVISLSHSFFYFSRIKELIKKINSSLNKKGILFIQIPDITKNPIYSLMGDQKFVFTSRSIINIFAQYGYDFKNIKHNAFPREVILVGSRKFKKDQIEYKNDDAIFCAISAIDSMKMKLRSIDDKNYLVLGTTANAAYADEIIGDKIKYFVDENPNKFGKKFRGKNIIHPKMMKSKDKIIIPYGQTGYKIKNRLAKQFNVKYYII
jgi:ubiquinone/menaquinone biosynthesis C-methylase UbiE